MSQEYLIRRYEHNYFHGWVVSTKRAGKRWAKYFSDKPDGSAAALRRAREYRRTLLERLPWPAKIKRTYARNTTGVIGVARSKEHTRSGRLLFRYVAHWPTRDGRYPKVSFSVNRYGEREARRLAIAARRRGLAQLFGSPQSH